MQILVIKKDFGLNNKDNGGFYVASCKNRLTIVIL